jgi:hypothetical protein
MIHGPDQDHRIEDVKGDENEDKDDEDKEDEDDDRYQLSLYRR